MLKNIKTALLNPSIARKFAAWKLKQKTQNGAPTKNIRDLMEIGGFSGFSEYLAVDNFCTDSEHAYFSNLKLDDGVILDIGANIGVLSIMFSQFFPNQTIHAFEPNPTTYKVLCKNVLQNNATTVKCHELAFAANEGVIHFNTDPIHRGTTSITNSEAPGANLVRSTTLDKFIEAEKIEKISLMKIDVEGYEALVFEGGKKMFSEMKPAVVYFEVYPVITKKAGYEPVQAATMLTEAGYSLYELRHNGQISPKNTKEIAEVFSENWIAVLK